MYAELNTKSDYCQNCGYDGEMQLTSDMEWYCPQCGCKDHTKLNIARRTCGLTYWSTLNPLNCGNPLKS